MEVCAYNQANSDSDGQAKLQVYQNESSKSADHSDDTDSEIIQKPLKKKKRMSQPLVIVICTPLMCRVHQNVQQAGEMVFCDATSSLDRFNTSIVMLSEDYFLVLSSLLIKNKKLLARFYSFLKIFFLMIAFMEKEHMKAPLLL